MKILRVIAALTVLAAAVFTGLIGKNKIADNGVSVSPTEYKGILTLWHIDTFEGGVGSRKQFLLSVSREFEKSHEGVLVMAMDYTAENAEKAMAEGKFPDLISYGAGVKVKNLQPITERHTESVSGGGYNGEIYALCWCRGGYCVIENPEYKDAKNAVQTLIVSQGEYTNPLVAYSMSKKTEQNFEILSPLNAYIKFTAGKSKCLLGTQRDINRLILRGMDFIARPLNGYNDLFQYISVVSTDRLKAAYAQKFAAFLTSDSVQRQLHRIGMFSCYLNVEYDSPDMSLMQKTNAETVLSAFSSKELIEEIQAAATLAAKGDINELSKIKKLIATP
ncbi:MAG: hypothetical protein IJQ07_02620 [Clostridia bacterium]|nr:hypothetical protein [Clostridia bacterium]